MTENNALGQRKYRGNFDPTLADRLNKEAELEKRKNKLHRLDNLIETADAKYIVIANPLDLSTGAAAVRDQESFIKHWAGFADERRMMNAADFYHIISQIRKEDEKSPLAKNDSRRIIITSMRSDCSYGNGLLFGSIIEYRALREDDSQAEIYQNDRPGSYYDDSSYNVIMMPQFHGNMAEGLKRDDELIYAQTLFDTHDNPEEIIRNMEFFTGVSRDFIEIDNYHTEPNVQQITYATGMQANKDGNHFCLCTPGPMYAKGLCRGVKKIMKEKE
jgi:hypothetical protein